MTLNDPTHRNTPADAIIRAAAADLDASDRALITQLDASASLDRAALPAGFTERLFNTTLDAYRAATPVRLVHPASHSARRASAAEVSGGGAANILPQRLFTPLRAAASVALIATVAAAMLAGGGRDRPADPTDHSHTANAAALATDQDPAADSSGVAGLLALALSPDDGVADEIDRLRLDSMLITGVLFDDSLPMPTDAAEGQFDPDAAVPGNSM